MMVHPFANNDLEPIILGMTSCQISFHCMDRYANAMDAAVSLYSAVAALRQHFKSDFRIHGVILDGGDSSLKDNNFIPQSSISKYFVRAVSDKNVQLLREKLRATAESTACAAGCRVDLKWRPCDGSDYKFSGMIHNKTMAEVYKKCSEEDGVRYSENVQPFYGSTDMGNVSLVVPSIHPGYSIGRQVMIHTREFEELAGNAEAQKWTLVAAKSMALTCVRLFMDRELAAKIKQEFLASQS